MVTRPAQAESSGYPDAVPQLTVRIMFGVDRNPNQSRATNCAGTMEIYADRIVVGGKSQTAVRTGAAAGGLVGALLGAAISAGSRKQAFTLFPGRGQVYMDPKGRTFSFQIGDRDWLFVSAPRRKDQPVLREAIERLFGPQVPIIQMGEMSTGQKKTVIVLLVIMGILMVVAAFSFMMAWLTER